jgi:anti-sigma factor RsiW
MCDFSGNLTAWLDHELPAREAAEVERHLAGCSECRRRADAYKQVTIEFDAFCDEVDAANARGKARRWAPVVSAAGAVAALVALSLIIPRTHVERPALPAPRAAVALPRVLVGGAMPDPVRPTQAVHRRRATATPAQIQNVNAQSTQTENVYSAPYEPVIQIAIPADEMFPPGAVPEGMHFAADLALAADGSAERLRLQPRLAGFERRSTLP